MFRSFPSEILDGRENNLFLDLLNSFRFDNRTLRESSGFKIRSLVIGAERALGDWTASLDWRMRTGSWRLDRFAGLAHEAAPSCGRDPV